MSKTIRTTIQTRYTTYEYDDEIEYNGTQEDLEEKVAELQSFYTQCIVNSFTYKWEEVDSNV